MSNTRTVSFWPLLFFSLLSLSLLSSPVPRRLFILDEHRPLPPRPARHPRASAVPRKKKNEKNCIRETLIVERFEDPFHSTIARRVEYGERDTRLMKNRYGHGSGNVRYRSSCRLDFKWCTLHALSSSSCIALARVLTRSFWITMNIPMSALGALGALTHGNLDALNGSWSRYGMILISELLPDCTSCRIECRFFIAIKFVYGWNVRVVGYRFPLSSTFLSRFIIYS